MLAGALFSTEDCMMQPRHAPRPDKRGGLSIVMEYSLMAALMPARFP